MSQKVGPRSGEDGARSRSLPPAAPAGTAPGVWALLRAVGDGGQEGAPQTWAPAQEPTLCG